MELLSYSGISDKEHKKITSFLNQIGVKPLDEKIKNKAIDIRRKNKLKLPDSTIIATSLIHDIPLVTADKQFTAVQNLQLILYKVS